MERVLQQCRSLLRHKYLPAIVTALTLLVFGATIVLITQQLKNRIRDQIARRDAEILHAVALMQQFRPKWRPYLDSASPPAQDEDELGSKIEEPFDQFIVIFETSRLKDVLAARLYTADGNYVGAFPDYVSRGRLPSADLLPLKALRPVSHYLADANLSDLFKDSSRPSKLQDQAVPLLDVLVPLHRQGKHELLGIAQFILDGEGIATEFAELDRRLYSYAATAFIGGTIIIVVALVWAFRRLQQSNRLLQERTARLLSANHELALAAKTSALGAVTAHLIHGLRSPLSGLQSFVANRSVTDTVIDDSEWQSAVATTHRMQTMISDIVRVLNEQDGMAQYEVTLSELGEIISTRTQPVARTAAVNLQIVLRADGVLASRNANLLLLILENLIDNALQATPEGKSVKLEAAPSSDFVVWEVRDEGPGFPESLRQSLFAPCRSLKGGSGIGLAISKQLANHLGAGLELKSSSADGCVFALTLPAKLLTGTTALVSGSESAEPISSATKS